MDLTLEVLNAKMKRETLVGNRTTVIIFFNHGNAAFFIILSWTAVFSSHLQSKWHEMIR